MRLPGSHPEHLEPDPSRRAFNCPIAFTSMENDEMTIPELQAAIIESKNKSQALAILFSFCGRFGINSNAPPEWWEKKEKLVQSSVQKQTSVPL